ncbi:MAG: hypothetical protein J1F22_07190 [Lachnospiraceae bacterium]|nr:hypothetical protein [Lachnospiraceae bacterium]
MEALKGKLIEISDCFYQDRTQEGMALFMEMAGLLAQVPAFAVFINPLFDALEQNDYILAADILYHEMAEKL